MVEINTVLIHRSCFDNITFNEKNKYMYDYELFKIIFSKNPHYLVKDILVKQNPRSTNEIIDEFWLSELKSLKDEISNNSVIEPSNFYMNLYLNLKEANLIRTNDYCKKMMFSSLNLINIDISVLMYAHNNEQTIEKSIKSILDQNYVYFELIIIDDNSTDQTPNIISNLSKNDIRIKV